MVSSQPGSKRWKHQVQKMCELSDPNKSVPDNSASALPDEQRSRKAKAWKNARIIRPSADTDESNSFDEVTAAPPQAVLELSSPSLGVGKKWKSQVAKMHEEEREDTPIQEPTYVTATPEQATQQEAHNSKRKFPKIKR